MSDEWGEDTLDYLLSCLKIARNLSIEDGSLNITALFLK